MVDENSADPFETDGGRRLLGRIRRDRNRQSILLGYPIRLKFLRSRKGWEGFMVEPLFLFSFQDEETEFGKPTLSDELPHINFAALRSLSSVGESSLLEEAITLADELGLGTGLGDQPDLDELFARLCDIRAEWDWCEEINPYQSSCDAPLSELNRAGIYNRAILIAAERSPYTRGLEFELGSLQSVTEEQCRGTALGAWLRGHVVDIPAPDEQPLVEVLPLNSEQRQAVRQAMANPLTIITGPPGTGKSQVVTSILINAARQGKTVLLASKNNKAVDVVESRVNALGPRPVLLRLGANEYQAKLAEYLVSLLAASATPGDHERYREQEAIQDKLQRHSDALDKEI